MSNWTDKKDVIELGADFNEEIDHITIKLIENYTKLYFSNYIGTGYKKRSSKSLFNKNIDFLPSNITHIKLGYSFDQIVNNLPDSLIWIEFGYCFNQSVDCLPNGVNYLVLGFSFNQIIDDLPYGLEYLNLNYMFNQSLNCLPTTLVCLFIGNDGCNSTSAVKYAGSRFTQDTTNLPTNLNNLTIYKNGKHVIKNNFVQELNKITNSKGPNKLNFDNNKYSIDNLYEGLTHLKIEKTCNNIFNENVNNLPSTLTHITFNDEFDKSVDNLPHLLYLKFGDQFNKSVDDLPSSLKYLIFGKDFNQLVDCLPNNLVCLEFYSKYNASFSQVINILPISLTNLILPHAYIRPINFDVFPSTLKTIKYHNEYKYIDNFPTQNIKVIKYY
jgi:hypothetical protein